MSDPQRPTKETLQVELSALMTSGHGEIKHAAEEMAQALDKLIKEGGELNEKIFREAINRAMLLPGHDYFNNLDAKVRKVMLELLEHAQQFLDAKVTDLVALNEKIKQEKKRLKDRIKEIEEQTKRSGLRR